MVRCRPVSFLTAESSVRVGRPLSCVGCFASVYVSAWTSETSSRPGPFSEKVLLRGSRKCLVVVVRFLVLFSPVEDCCGCLSPGPWEGCTQEPRAVWSAVEFRRVACGVAGLWESVTVRHEDYRIFYTISPFSKETSTETSPLTSTLVVEG